MALVASPYGFRPVRLISGRETGGAFPTEQFPIKSGYSGVIPYGSPVVLTAPASIGTISGITVSGTTATVTTSSAHGLVVGQPVTIASATGNTTVNGTWIVLAVPTTTTFTYTYPGANQNAVTGSPTGTANGGYLNLPTDGGFNSAGDHYVGIFVGSQYVNPNNNQPQWDQWYPGSVTAPTNTSIYGYVVTDPEVVLQVQAQYAQFDAQSNLGYSYKFYVPATAYNSTNKNSVLALDAGTGSSGTNSAYPYKVVGYSTDPNNTNAVGYVDVYVKAQSAVHLYERAL